MYFFCESCEHECKSKKAFNKHIATEKHRRNVSIQQNPEHTCTICNKSYKLKGNYDKHMIQCKNKIETGLLASGIPEQQVSNVLATLNHNTAEPPALIDNNQPISTTNNNNISTQNNINTQNNQITTQNNQTANTINNTTQNIYITPFGKEDISMITQEMRREIIEHEKRAFEFLLKELYKHKTNYNIFISDKRNGLVKYLNGENTLQVGQLNDMLGEMIDNHKKILDDFIDKFGESFRGGVPERLLELKDDHECGERDDKYMKLSKKKLLEISETAKTLLQKQKK
jgi:hypothetical protein